MKKLVDLSHTVEEGVLTYKGLPAPLICDYLSREASKSHYHAGTSFQIGKIEMVGNTGTYLDSPFHRYADGKDLSELELDAVAELDGLCFSVPASQKAIGSELFGNINVRGKAVLVRTGWDQHWATDQYFEGHPYLTREAAEWLKDAGAVLVGIDSHNIDDTGTRERPVHSILLGAEILIVEHLCNLDKVVGKEFTFNAVPVKVKKFGTFPVRAYASMKPGSDA